MKIHIICSLILLGECLIKFVLGGIANGVWSNYPWPLNPSYPSVRNLSVAKFDHNSHNIWGHSGPNRIKRSLNQGHHDPVKDTLDLLSRGEALIDLQPTDREIILIVGGTGVGKTTLTLFLTQNTSQLISYKDKGVRYLIKDIGGKIGTRTTVSKSIFPERVVHQENPSQIFYDCPGFSDTRNISVEIANTFFIKKVADHAHRLKLVLVIDYASVVEGGSRDKFPNLMRDTLNLCKNMTKFKHSVLLAVTKVTETADTLESDIVEGIAGFLQNVKSDLVSNDWSGEKLTMAIQLIDALLDQDGNETMGYTKIGIFRQPRRSGPLSQIPEVEQCKITLNRIITHNVQFVQTIPNDFGYTLSTRASLEISKLSVGINEEIVQLISLICGESGWNFLTPFQNLTSSIMVQNLRQNYNDLGLLIETMEGRNQNLTVIQLISQLSHIRPTCGNSSNVDVKVSEILRRENFLTFLEKPGGGHVTREFLKWAQPVKSLVSQLSLLLGKIVQETYNVNEGLMIFKGKYVSISEVINSQANLPKDTHTILILALDTVFLDRDIVGSTLLSSPLNLTIISPKWVIEGDRIINLNGSPGPPYVPKEAGKNNIGEGINGLPGLPGQNGGNFLGIGDSFFGSGLEISALGGRGGQGQDGGIGANGVRGEDAHLRGVQHKAWSSTFWPNSWAKITFSPYFEYDTADTCNEWYLPAWVKATVLPDLSINSEGIQQSNEVTNWAPYCKSFVFFGKNGTAGKNGGDGGIGGQGGYKGTVSIIGLNDQDDPKIQMRDITMDGTIGQGGLGGRGGVGGWPGSRQFAFFYKPSVFITFVERMIGEVNSLENHDKPDDVVPHRSQDGSTDYYFAEQGVDWRYPIKVEFGANGVTGKSNSNQHKISNPSPVRHLPASRHINMFKIFALETLADDLKSQPLMNHQSESVVQFFLQKMDKNDSIRSLYNFSDLLDEYTRLEVIDQKLTQSNLPMFPIYDSLLERILYAANKLNYSTTPTNQKSLLYLYTAVYSKSCRLLYNDLGGDTTLIVDLEKYLNLAREHLISLKIAQRNVETVKIITATNAQYQLDIQKKSLEATNFISDVITPAIEANERQINLNIDKLLNEIQDIRKKAINDTIDMVQQEKKLQAQLGLRIMFSVFKGVGALLSFLGPIGAVAGTAIGGISTVAETFVLDDKTGTGKSISIPASVRFSMDRISTTLNQQKADVARKFNQQLTDIAKDLGNYPELKTTTEQVNTLQGKVTRLEKMSFPDNPVMQQNHKEFIEENKTKLKAALVQQEKSIKGDKDVSFAKIERNQKILGVAQGARMTLDVAVDIYSQHRQDKAKLSILASQIENGKAGVKALEEFEVRVENNMRPMVQSFQNVISTARGDLKERSVVGLDVSKWQIQSMIRGMKLEIQQFTKELKVDQFMSRAVDQLDESMTTLISLFNRIQDFQQQSKLAHFISDIHKAGFSDEHPEVGKLNLIIKANAIKLYTESARHALIMWSFPLAHVYLTELNLEQNSHFNMTPPRSGQDLESIVDQACSRLEKMKSAVIKSKSVVQKFDRYVRRNVKFNLEEPFIVWKNPEFNESIAKILSGEKVLLKADIVQSPPFKDSIKANRIEIIFRVTSNDSKSELTQQNLDRLVKQFEVRLEHMGNSYYRYKEKYYKISSDRQVIEFSFERDGQTEEPKEKNLVYDKILGGDMSISPYAFWQIQIIPVPRFVNNLNETYHQLKGLFNLVQLELVGEGSYVKQGTDTTFDLMLGNYYVPCF